MNSLLAVSAGSLATHVGIIDDGQGDLTETERSQLLKMQLGILQQKPRSEQNKIHNETAAKYLPALVERYRASSGVLNASTTLLNVISYTPHFIRFSRTASGAGLAGLQARRTAEAVSNNVSLDADEIGELGQFLSTLLVLQGAAGIEDGVKKTLVPKFRRWERAFPGWLASTTSDRCIALLTDSPEMRPMLQFAKTYLESPLEKCGESSCERVLQSDGASLMQCARCKAAVYCGADHQKKAWQQHKLVCFAPTF